MPISLICAYNRAFSTVHTGCTNPHGRPRQATRWTMCGCAASRTAIRSRPPSPGSTRNCGRRRTRLVPLRTAAGRVLAAAVVSEVDVPGFDRATMDGYAVVADSTEGATSYNRLPLIVIGDSLPGRPFDGSVGAGQAVRIMTGAPLPLGCDAVLPAEWIEDVRPRTDSRRVSALAAVSPGKHVGRRGEDIVRGTTLLQAGRVLRPQDLGVLSSVGSRRGAACSPAARSAGGDRQRTAAVGIAAARLSHRRRQRTDARRPRRARRRSRRLSRPGARRPRRDPGGAPGRCRCDHRLGRFECRHRGPRADASSRSTASWPFTGSPCGPAARPASGESEHRLVFLLPGNPVSCLCAYDFFAGRAIRALGGRAKAWPYRPIARQADAQDQLADRPARLRPRADRSTGCVEPLAVGGASVLSSTTRADGFVIVPDDSEGFAPGADVEVWLYA